MHFVSFNVICVNFISTTASNGNNAVTSFQTKSIKCPEGLVKINIGWLVGV